MPSWPPRLASNSSNQGASSPSPSQSTGLPQRTTSSVPSQNVRASPVRPSLGQNGSSPTMPSPGRSPSSAGLNQNHNRSVSHPLPRIFSRGKTSNASKGPADLPPDDSLVPVLDDSLTGTPTKLVGGKRRDEREENLATKHCMCCGNKVRFPRDLKVFRCTSCLTVNDIEPYKPKDKNGREQSTQNDKSPGPRTVVPLSVERSRAIIDQCLVTYLEARCRREQAARIQPPVGPPRTVSASAAHNMTSPDPFREAGTTAKVEPTPSLMDHPDSPVNVHSATIKEVTDFDWFPLTMEYKYSPDSTSRISRKPVAPPTPEKKPEPMPAPISVPAVPPSRRPPAPPAQDSTASIRATPPRRQSSRRNAVGGAVPNVDPGQRRYERIKTIFRPLEDYLLSTFGEIDCLDASFSTLRPRIPIRTVSDPITRTPPPERIDIAPSPLETLSQLDAKTLLLGDFAENGTWWAGRDRRNRSDKRVLQTVVEKKRSTTSKTPNIDWSELNEFFDTVHTAGDKWWNTLDDDKFAAKDIYSDTLKAPRVAKDVDDEICEAKQHAERALLKITETLLKRPTRPITEPDQARFLLILLCNPSLYPHTQKSRTRAVSNGGLGSSQATTKAWSLFPPTTSLSASNATPTDKDAEKHTGILKRIFGLMANASDSCHRYIIGWFSRLDEEQFIHILDLVASFVTYRLSRQKSRPRPNTTPQDGGLILDLSGSAMNTFAQLNSVTGLSGGGLSSGRSASTKTRQMETQSVVDYSEDWQLRAAGKVMALLFAANNSWQTKKGSLTPAGIHMTSLSRPRARTHGQLLPTSDFYDTLLDYHDLIADFKAWESKKAKFTFCQYPFFLSMGAKIRVLEYDARRQMEIKAREAYFDSVTTHRAVDGYFHLRVRRDCMAEDSLKQISEAVGAGQEELKKGLRVHFNDEEGVDAGGLRKEWFLMLVRDIFDPNHGMFLYDDDSHTCYFNPNSFETSDQFYLVGALLGLAIYNSTILDVAFPSFAFRKLLAAAPSSSSSLPTAKMTYTVDDLAEYRPALASGLQQLLDFQGDVETTFCRDFVAPSERYGVVTDVPLCPGGAKKAVTNANRHEFVDLYIRYLLDTAVARQFEPFKRGFFTVCAGNALSLFRPEEIELLVRGSDESLDVDSLRAVAVYENWRDGNGVLLRNPAEQVDVLRWFWEEFKAADPGQQRKLLGFITGSDRISAVGATNLVLRVVGGGDGVIGVGSGIGVQSVREKEMEKMRERERFPVARTCFNMIVLWGYESRAVLGEKLWRAVAESEGFGLK